MPTSQKCRMLTFRKEEISYTLIDPLLIPLRIVVLPREFVRCGHLSGVQNSADCASCFTARAHSAPPPFLYSASLKKKTYMSFAHQPFRCYIFIYVIFTTIRAYLSRHLFNNIGKAIPFQGDGCCAKFCFSVFANDAFHGILLLKLGLHLSCSGLFFIGLHPRPHIP